MLFLRSVLLKTNHKSLTENVLFAVAPTAGWQNLSLCDNTDLITNCFCSKYTFNGVISLFDLFNPDTFQFLSSSYCFDTNLTCISVYHQKSIVAVGYYLRLQNIFNLYIVSLFQIT